LTRINVVSIIPAESYHCKSEFQSSELELDSDEELFELLDLLLLELERLDDTELLED